MEMRFHWLTPITSSFLGLLASLSATDPFDLLWILQGGSSILLHMTFSIIYGSSQAGSRAKGRQETVLFNYLNTLINKEPWGLSPQILLSKVLYKAFTSNTRGIGSVLLKRGSFSTCWTCCIYISLYKPCVTGTSFNTPASFCMEFLSASY